MPCSSASRLVDGTIIFSSAMTSESIDAELLLSKKCLSHAEKWTGCPLFSKGFLNSHQIISHFRCESNLILRPGLCCVYVSRRNGVRIRSLSFIYQERFSHQSSVNSKALLMSRSNSSSICWASFSL